MKHALTEIGLGLLGTLAVSSTFAMVYEMCVFFAGLIKEVI